ncbi:MAG: CRISPR/Cas system-associated exonuclease Cas4 (RecB family) [Planctomycetota bacterium]|jgi:CRISPR/Cas system-associated exonuclease Cas4 (RecB family)
MAFQHELSWSASRSGTFAACKRRYYYDYYYSWNGWLRESPEGRQSAWRLKKMTRLPMLAGDVLHQAIAEYFDMKSEGREMLEDELVGFAVKKLRDAYKESRDGRGLWRNRPSQSAHLAEHHFKEECIDEKTDAAAEYGKRFVERLRTGGKFFMNSPELASLHQLTRDQVLCVEGRAPGNRASRDMPTIELFGTKVFAIPDFACKTEEAGGTRYWIYDWKSGSPREADVFQLGVYTLYAMEKWGAAPEQVNCVDVYLTKGELVSLTHTQDDLAPILSRIEGSLAEMREMHFDAGDSAGDEAPFPMVDAPSRECTSCNYRELCGRQ